MRIVISLFVFLIACVCFVFPSCVYGQRSPILSSVPPRPVIHPEPEFTRGLSNEICWSSVGEDSVEYRVLVFDLSAISEPPPPPPPWDPSEWIPDTCHTFNTTYRDVPFQNGHKYQYIIHAKYAGQWEVSISDPVISTQENDAPLPVPEVQITSLSQGRIRLAWPSTTDPTSNVDWYRIFRRADENLDYNLICTIADSTSRNGLIQYSIEDNLENGLVDGRVYWYKIIPVDTVGNVQILNAQEVSMLVDASSPLPPFLFPEPEFTGGECNTIHWEDRSQGDAAFFQVQIDVNDSNFTSPDSVPSWLPSSMDSVRICDRHDNFTYYYRVRATDLVGNVSHWSNIVHSTQDRVPPEPVQTLIIKGESSGDVVLEWESVADSTSNVDWYVIYRATTFHDLQRQASVRDSVADTESCKQYRYIDRYSDPMSGLENNQLYYYVVIPVDTVGNARISGNNIDSTRVILSPCGKAPFPLPLPNYTKGWEVTVCWNDFEPKMDVYKVLCKTTCQCGDPFVKESDWISDSCFTFIGLCEDLTQYCFQVRGRVLDPYCESDTSDRFCTVLDNTPPNVTGAPEVQSLPGRDIYINWEDVLTTDKGSGVDRVELYRFDTHEKLSSLIATFGTPIREYTDLHLENGLQACHVYSYYLIAFDELGWSSGESGWSVPTPSDTGLVFTPILIALPEFTKGVFQKVQWEFPGERSCGNNWVYEPYAGAVSVTVECAPDTNFYPGLTRSCGWIPADSFCEFGNLFDGITYHYRAQARDRWGHVAQSERIISSTQDASPPDPVTNLKVISRADGSPRSFIIDVKLEWDGTQDALSGLAQYIVLRTIIHRNGTIVTESIDTLSYKKNTYWDNNTVDVSTDSVVSYTIHPLDSVDNKRTEGNPIVFLDLLQPPARLLPQSKNILYWSSVSSANLYFAEAAADSQILGTWLIGVDSTAAQSDWISDTCFTFTFTTESEKVYFHVKARDVFGNESGWSQIFAFPIERKVPLGSGWNLVSLPLEPFDLDVDVHVPNGASAFSYGDLSYAEVETLQVGQGYWIGVPVPDVLSVAGTIFTTYTLQLSEGWNLIGSLSEPVSVSNIVAEPEGMINLETIYGYEGGYYLANLIEPGKGYWIYTFDKCLMALSCANWVGVSEPDICDGVVRARAKGSQKIPLWLATVRIHNGTEKAVLAFGVSKDANDAYNHGYDLFAPPSSPFRDGLTAYFVSAGDEHLWQDIRNGDHPTWTLVMNSSSPIHMTLDVPDIHGDLRLFERKTGQQLYIMDNNSITLSGGNYLYLISIGPNIPDDYDLVQNYPNPFNPSTHISFQLPVVNGQSTHHTTLKIYNILGQEVRTLVDEAKEPGYYTTTWDGKTDSGESVSSGFYLYRLQAGGFFKIRKMLVLK